MDDKYSNTQLKLVTESTPEALESPEWKEIRRERLINSLNRINFQDGEVMLNFKHSIYNTFITCPAKPQPCLDHYFECKWTEQEDDDKRFDKYIFENLYFSDGLKQVLVDVEPISSDRNGIRFILPETALEVTSRKVRRHKCSNIKAQLSQDGFVLDGYLTNFSAASFSVSIPGEAHANSQYKINRQSPVNIILKNEPVYIYSGRCEIFRQTESASETTFIIKPFNGQTQRYKSKKFRSIRQGLKPSPNIIFHHPFISKKVNLKITDISGSGFSVEERFDNSLLLPGMIIPDLIIEFMNGLDLQCKCQVIYRTAHDYKTVKCGFAFLDMGLKDQIRLSSYLHQAMNENCHVCTKIDLDELWDFFFESGFVYPEKYFFIHANRKKFEEVYKKLYEYDSDIAINFIYQDKGSIYGHMSMFRFYEKTWVINHHAANSAKSSRAGLAVLEQIGRYINEFHRLPSTKMDYVACYFRPENRFPNLTFGGAARNSSEGCTLDEFAYIHLNKKGLLDNLPKSWSLTKATSDDIIDLNNYYDQEFGGLTLKALDITPSRLTPDNKLNDDFKAAGFKRDRHLYSLRYRGELVAVCMVNVTEIGMNMSDLTNCIHVFVKDAEKLPSEKLNSTLFRLSSHYDHDNLSVLVHPKSYIDHHSISYNKTYNFWVLDVDKSSDEYFKHVERLIKRVKKHPEI